jgi:hypothetical protein
LTAGDAIDAYRHFYGLQHRSSTLRHKPATMYLLLRRRQKQNGPAFGDTLVGACSSDPQRYGVKAIAEK